MTMHSSTRAMLRGAVSVRADATDANRMLEQLNRAWAEFQAKADKDMKDVVRQEEVGRINDAISALQGTVDDMNVRLQARPANTPETRPGDDAEYRGMFANYFRTGEGESAIKANHAKGPRAALSVGTPADGGLTAPIEWDRQVVDALRLVSPMRQIATVQQIGVAGFTRLWNPHGASSGWVAETAARPQTNTSQFQQISFPMGQLYAMPAATQDILDDSLIDIEAWHAREVEMEFAVQEGTAFVNGNGTNRPKGFLTYATAQAEHPAGAIPKITSGNAGALTADGIVNLIYDLPSVYAANARFVMNRNSQGRVRLLKDGQGNYLWQPSYQAGQPPTLLGYPITEMPDMPNVGANTYPIAFGDFARGYLIIDRFGIRVLRDPYTAKPYVLFYTTKRVGGGVNDPTAMRLHQIAV